VPTPVDFIVNEEREVLLVGVEVTNATRHHPEVSALNRL